MTLELSSIKTTSGTKSVLLTKNQEHPPQPVLAIKVAWEIRGELKTRKGRGGRERKRRGLHERNKQTNKKKN